MREAVNNCLAHWMNAEPWSADDPRWRALHGWLDAHAHARERAYALEYEIVPPASELSGGDAERGRDVFNGRCVVCHGEDGAGTGRAPRVAGLGLPGDYVARRVRTSGAKDNPIYDELTGGVMPFWAKDRLSDSQLRDIVAFLALLGADAGVDAGGGTSVDAGAGSGQACAATHAKVGDRAEFVMEFHGVGGTATVVDDCTIEISDFAYDGNGIDVRIYGGLGGDYHGGFAMSDDLLKPGGYLGETIQAVLPVDKTLDDLDGLSVWCVDVGVSFGEARF
jgi:mono/diheme cytochrome c family protein